MAFSARKFIFAFLSLLAFQASLQACPVCFAAPESPESRGMTIAILFLLGTIGVVLCGVASFVIYLVAKQKEPRPQAELFMEEQPIFH